MKRRIIEHLSPDFLFAVFGILAGVGLIFMVAGSLTGNKQLVSMGWWLCLPLMLGAGGLMFVIIPILIYVNIRRGIK